MRSAGLGAGALALPAALTACGDDEGAGAAGKEVSFGSNYSDPVPKSAMEAVLKAYEKKSDKKVKVNTVNHNTFQENINRYLQGTPDDVFMWFAGYRMQFFAEQGLAADICDLWKRLGGGFSDALKKRPPARTASSTSCRTTTTRGPSSTGRASSQQRGYEIPEDVRRVPGAGQADEEGRPRRRSPSATRTAGRRWAPSTTSICGPTATTSTSR